jgi:hypothetical protein
MGKRRKAKKQAAKAVAEMLAALHSDVGSEPLLWTVADLREIHKQRRRGGV